MNNPSRRILILYTELAGYSMACIRALSVAGHDVTVLHWPVNPEAPFELSPIKDVTFIAHDAQDVAQVSSQIQQCNPDLIMCSGWIDKSYLRALYAYKGKARTILAMDTQWNGSAKQRLMTAISPLIRKRFFSHAWVAGAGQKEYALRLGFPAEQVQTGLYSADTDLYEKIYRTRKMALGPTGPRSFLFVGRYIQHKGIQDLCAAFVQAKKRMPSDWKLICAGTGEQFAERYIHEAIEHLGFKQPEEMTSLIRDASVFVLPSHFEPWGVVVHEMAQAGLPLILSDKIGGAEQFLSEGKNGLTFEAGNIKELSQRLLEMMQRSEEELEGMGTYSHKLAAKQSPEIWVETLLAFM
jgi:glycosyltransferase involved in cell wall biosynthesis